VVLRSSELIIYDQHAEVARHPRVAAKDAENLMLDHYLEALTRKPGAMPCSAALDQARAAGASGTGQQKRCGVVRQIPATRLAGGPAAIRSFPQSVTGHRARGV
jgi:hypothetical protein